MNRMVMIMPLHLDMQLRMEFLVFSDYSTRQEREALQLVYVYGMLLYYIATKPLQKP